MESGEKCNKCGRIPPKLVPEFDDGTGRKICVPCKRKMRLNHPDKDFRHKKGDTT